MRLRILAAAMVLIGSAAASAVSNPCDYDNDAGYRVDAPVVVRTGPSAHRTAIYDLPPTARAIRCLGPCRSGWCRIRWHGVVGWIPHENLIADGTVRYTTEPFP